MDTSLIWSGALLAASGGIIYSLKAIPNKLYQRVRRNLIYTVKVYQYDELFWMLEQYLSTHHSNKYKDVEASVQLMPDSGVYPPSNTSNGEEEKKEICYKQEEAMFIIKYKGKKIVIEKSKEKIDKATSIKDIYFRKYSVSGFLAKKQIDDFLKMAIAFSETKKETNIIKVHTNDIYGNWRECKNVKVKPLEKTILPSNIKLPLIKDIDEFSISEDWYVDTSIPYKRGMCLYGPPGTGKTTLALAIAHYTKRRIYCLNLNCLENDSRLPQCFNDMNEKSILLIEDIDKVFSGRENVSDKCEITFSSLLNCLDGAFYKHGLITIITTNHIDKLDEALLRTGRIDMKIEIPIPTDKEISEYLSIFYKKPTFVIQGNFNLRMSDVQEICLKNKANIEDAVKELNRSKI